MKWQKTTETDRTITKFLLWPECAGGEYRWLEKATIRQVFNPKTDRWDNEEWVDVVIEDQGVIKSSPVPESEPDLTAPKGFTPEQQPVSTVQQGD